MEAEHLSSKQRIYQQNCQGEPLSHRLGLLLVLERELCVEVPSTGARLRKNQGWGPSFASHMLFKPGVIP